MGSQKTSLCKVGIFDFYMAEVPVTQALYKKIMNFNPSKIKGDDHPVESVSWYDAIIFCNALSDAYKLEPCYSVKGNTKLATIEDKSPLWNDLVCNFKGPGFRLPTEAEWEYAAQAGSAFLYSGSDNIDEVAWYGENSEISTHDVGKKNLMHWVYLICQAMLKNGAGTGLALYLEEITLHLQVLQKEVQK